MGMVPLSYFYTPNLSPGKELLGFFNDSAFSFLREIDVKNKPVFAVGKCSDVYDYELYFYRYWPDRPGPPVILDNDIPYDFLKGVHPLYNNTQHIPKDYIISSLDADSNGTVMTSHINYYYGESLSECPEEYCYRAEEYNVLTGTSVVTNIYGLYDDIVLIEPHHKEFVKKYKTDMTIAFVAQKKLKGAIGYYFEHAGLKMFLQFLQDASYDPLFIKFCERNYDDRYVFSFSFDIDIQTREMIKSKIYSVYE